jgi:hypothetical protein
MLILNFSSYGLILNKNPQRYSWIPLGIRKLFLVTNGYFI